MRNETVQNYLLQALNISSSVTCSCIDTASWIDFFDMIIDKPEAQDNSEVKLGSIAAELLEIYVF